MSIDAGGGSTPTTTDLPPAGTDTPPPGAPDSPAGGKPADTHRAPGDEGDDRTEEPLADTDDDGDSGGDTGGAGGPAEGHRGSSTRTEASDTDEVATAGTPGDAPTEPLPRSSAPETDPPGTDPKPTEVGATEPVVIGDRTTAPDEVDDRFEPSTAQPERSTARPEDREETDIQPDAARSGPPAVEDPPAGIPPEPAPDGDPPAEPSPPDADVSEPPPPDTRPVAPEPDPSATGEPADVDSVDPALMNDQLDPGFDAAHEPLAPQPDGDAADSEPADRPADHADLPGLVDDALSFFDEVLNTQQGADVFGWADREVFGNAEAIQRFQPTDKAKPGPTDSDSDSVDHGQQTRPAPGSDTLQRSVDSAQESSVGPIVARSGETEEQAGAEHADRSRDPDDPAAPGRRAGTADPTSRPGRPEEGTDPEDGFEGAELSRDAVEAIGRQLQEGGQAIQNRSDQIVQEARQTVEVAGEAVEESVPGPVGEVAEEAAERLADVADRPDLVRDLGRITEAIGDTLVDLSQSSTGRVAGAALASVAVALELPAVQDKIDDVRDYWSHLGYRGRHREKHD